MANVTVSVIIPAYNAAPYVGHAIESVLEQSVDNREIIVVDDGSTDGTACRLAAYSGSIRSVHQPHRGVAAARNYGASLARGEWLAFLDADDFWYPHKLRDQLGLALLTDSIDFVMSNYHTVEETGRLSGEAFADHPMVGGRADENGPRTIVFGPEAAEAYARHRFGIMSTMLVRTDTFRRIGGMDERFHVAEDIHLMYRLVAQARCFGAVCRPGAAYRNRRSSASHRDAEERHRVTLEVLSDLVRHHRLPRGMVRAIREEITRTRTDLAYLLARQRRRFSATLAAGRAFGERLSWRTLRTVVSVNRPIRSEPSPSEADPVQDFLFGVMA